MPIPDALHLFKHRVDVLYRYVSKTGGIVTFLHQRVSPFSFAPPPFLHLFTPSFCKHGLGNPCQRSLSLSIELSQKKKGGLMTVDCTEYKSIIFYCMR